MGTRDRCHPAEPARVPPNHGAAGPAPSSTVSANAAQRQTLGRIRTVVIDVDDTLCLTEAACFELENDVLRRLGRPPMDRSVHLSTWGQPLLAAMEQRSPGIDLDRFSGVYSQVLGDYIEGGRIDSIERENLDAIDALLASGREVMLLTSREEAEIAHMLADDHVLSGRISAVFHAGNTTHVKPDPRAFDALLTQSRLRPDECVYVGDSPGDAVAAKGAGLHFIGCLQSGVRCREDFELGRVDSFIETFPQVVEAVAALDRSSVQE
jgi:phosphoglycolate phosphatase